MKHLKLRNAAPSRHFIKNYASGQIGRFDTPAPVRNAQDAIYFEKERLYLLLLKKACGYGKFMDVLEDLGLGQSGAGYWD